MSNAKYLLSHNSWSGIHNCAHGSNYPAVSIQLVLHLSTTKVQTCTYQMQKKGPFHNKGKASKQPLLFTEKYNVT